MADPGTTDPLLSGETPATAPASSLEEIIERSIGDFGWAQLLQVSLVSLAWAFDAQQTFISVVTDANPTWHCTDHHSSCNSATDMCQLPRGSWAWDMPADASIVSDWSLECASSVIRGLPASCFFLGCLIGGLVLATLADSSSLGRKNMMLLSCLLMSLAGLFTAASTNIWMYSALRFVSGFGRATVGTCALVLSTELVGKRRRGQVGSLSFLFFTFGFLSLPAIAYLNRGSSWRSIYLWTCIPTIPYCVLFHFLGRESPRWLFLQGHKEKFMATIKSIASHSSFTLRNLPETVCIEHDSSNSDLFSAIKILLDKKWAIRRLSAVMLVGFGIGMVYYGMPLGVGSLGFNLYLNVTLNALSELPSTLASFFLIGKINRKGSIFGFCILSGVCSVMCCVLMNMPSMSTESGWIISTGLFQIGAETVSFFSVCTAFNVLLIYTLELFPTCVRNSAMSMVRQAIVLGGVFSPVLVAAGRRNGVLSYGVFGVTIIFCGLFVAFLPETKGSSICDTMDEEEHKVFKTEASGCSHC
ncbi:hypothetical protein RHSIM_Rhsim01G0077200 [Rhododendron simsii]|uniref:Major facilitator superfamily (MFS) profile domain-containing protein n=1 Tax=Rhododendron simsii TaxID=118357 RepID=A0A834HHK4_RHOSS|nr:hypothetical protein RHSIM_Rhsim01G0077200 [Rhododendron simsii]